MRITVTHDDGTTTDVTEGVQVTYDIARHSMDWGSGFLDLEEMDAVARLGDACRFPDFEEALQEVHEARRKQEEAPARRDAARRRQREIYGPWIDLPARDALAIVQAAEQGAQRRMDPRP